MIKSNSIVKMTGVVVLLALASVSLATAEQKGIQAGSVKILPYGDLITKYNSNVETQPDDEKDDVSLTLKAGAGVVNNAEQTKLSADVWALIERYADLTDEDHEDFGESISLGFMQNEKVKIGLSQSYENIQSLDYAIGAIRARELLKAGLSAVSELSDKVRLNAFYAYNSTDYESEREFDWDEHSVTVLGQHKMTDKSDATIGLVAMLQDSDGFDDSADQYAATFGVTTRGTDKVTGTARIGVLHRNDVEDETIPHYEVAGSWAATDKLNVLVRLKNAIEPGTLQANDYNEVVRGSITADLEMINGFGLVCDLGYSRNDYFVPVDVDGVSTAKDDDTYSGAVKLTYQTASPLLSAFLEAKLDDKQSSIPANEYQQTTVSLGAKVVY